MSIEEKEYTTERYFLTVSFEDGFFYIDLFDAIDGTVEELKFETGEELNEKLKELGIENDGN